MRTKIVSVAELENSDTQSMYRLLCEYYDEVSEDVFLADLSEKQKVILLLGSDASIQGFSTISQTTLIANDKKFIALYSGDTVLSRDYWGNGALAMTFGRYLVEVKLKNPTISVYWFLISKGYKTYLLMTNNFPVHFPRYEKRTPEPYQNVMNVFYKSRFGDFYFQNEKLIRFENKKAARLKYSVAEIEDELRKNPRIAFFEKCNPQWAQGVELACVAKVTLWIPLRYILKRFIKYFSMQKNFAK